MHFQSIGGRREVRGGAENARRRQQAPSATQLLLPSCHKVVSRQARKKEALKRGKNLRLRLRRPRPQLLLREFVSSRRREAAPWIAFLTARSPEGETAARCCRPPRADGITSSKYESVAAGTLEQAMVHATARSMAQPPHWQSAAT